MLMTSNRVPETVLVALVSEPQTCPYCKIDFVKHPWAARSQPRVVCVNCRNYHEATVLEAEHDAEMEVARSARLSLADGE